MVWKELPWSGSASAGSLPIPVRRKKGGTLGSGDGHSSVAAATTQLGQGLQGFEVGDGDADGPLLASFPPELLGALAGVEDLVDAVLAGRGADAVDERVDRVRARRSG